MDADIVNELPGFHRGLDVDDLTDNAALTIRLGHGCLQTPASERAIPLQEAFLLAEFRRDRLLGFSLGLDQPLAQLLQGALGR
jgi:hypothetical protein